MHRYLLHNGSVYPTATPLLSPGQTGFMNGWGIFSTLRIKDGVLFAYERHWQRMMRDATRIRVPIEVSREQLHAQLMLLVEANHAYDATLRVAIVRNHGGVFEAPGIKHDSDVIAFTAPIKDWGAGVHLGYCPRARFGGSRFAGTKYTSWAENLTLNEAAQELGFDEFILLNEEGSVSECTSANIFAIQGDRLLTPPLSTSGCLPGITRALLLEEISVPGLRALEEELSPSQLEASEAIFITSSTRDLLPVLTIDGEPVPSSTPHLPVLREAFARNVDTYVERNKTPALTT